MMAWAILIVGAITAYGGAAEAFGSRYDSDTHKRLAFGVFLVGAALMVFAVAVSNGAIF